MSRIDYVSGIIYELGTAMGLPDLALDDKGRLSLRFDSIPVTFHYTAEPVELLWLMVDLGELDPDDRETLNGVLRLGFLTWLGNRMTLALSDDSRRVLGHSAIPVVNLDLGLLKQTLAQLMESAEMVAGRIARRDFDPGLEQVAGEEGKPPPSQLV